ncbi:Hypothetical predicted protein [Cloeon dipterum]|uniref:MYND-type domain-containing protein n=1 Tax=Cloeon dipterum TaxID=197152 RepID=A0A8S1E782_9INSE|nr:Hypothetical predicted protein [Cloeon dipterum]
MATDMVVEFPLMENCQPVVNKSDFSSLTDSKFWTFSSSDGGKKKPVKAKKSFKPPKEVIEALREFQKLQEAQKPQKEIEEHTCNTCKKSVNKNFLTCGECLKTGFPNVNYYCSKSCQTAAWETFHEEEHLISELEKSFNNSRVDQFLHTRGLTTTAIHFLLNHLTKDHEDSLSSTIGHTRQIVWNGNANAEEHNLTALLQLTHLESLQFLNAPQDIVQLFLDEFRPNLRPICVVYGQGKIQGRSGADQVFQQSQGNQNQLLGSVAVAVILGPSTPWAWALPILWDSATAVSEQETLATVLEGTRRSRSCQT